MQNDTTMHLIERLSALHRNLMRKFATEAGLQFVHIEILHYLSLCNHYSDTTQAISEYLGQTKGSISQSLAYLEQHNYVKRFQDKKDKRVFHLSLTAKGYLVSERLSGSINLQNSIKEDSSLFAVLVAFQKKNGMKSFGICATCKFNQNPGAGTFICGLTQEKLKLEDTQKICREHEAG